MLFTTVLPAIAALVGVASAVPLEARGGRNDYHQYKKQCAWEPSGWKTFSCSNKDWWHERNCCKTEWKCTKNWWNNSWECCAATEWDWDHDCPKKYYRNKDADYQKYIYYGGNSWNNHQQYDDDCKYGRNNYWQKKQYKSYKEFCDKNPGRGWGQQYHGGNQHHYNNNGHYNGGNKNNGHYNGGNNQHHDNNNGHYNGGNKNNGHYQGH